MSLIHRRTGSCPSFLFMTITNLVNRVYFYTNTSSTSFSAANMLLAINNAYERVVSLIMQTDGRWEWDDNNQTDLPIATATLTSSQSDYSLAVTHLTIVRVEVKDTAGLWTQLTPINQSDFAGTALAEFLKTAGPPSYYDKIGSSIFLYPAPNYTQAASLKITFQRPPALYTAAEVTTGTKEPGFNSLYHNLIALWVAYDFAIAHGLPNANQLRAEIKIMEDNLMSDYELRSRDEPLRLKVVHNNPR
mgnify:CR=1 FL=1